MVQFVACVELQLSFVDAPETMLVGVAEIFAVGAGVEQVGGDGSSQISRRMYPAPFIAGFAYPH